MKRVSRDLAMDSFDSQLEPVVEIATGEQVVIETNAGAIPATGPIAIRGASPGDIAIVAIHHIELKEAHWWWLQKSASPRRQTGVYREMAAHLDEYPHSQHPRFGRYVDIRVPLTEDFLLFSERVRAPIKPMIGCIGVAPPGAPMPANQSGATGGNLDCREIRPGSRVYLPLFAHGGLLGLGDVHAAQGDGELLPVAECVAEVTLSVELRKQQWLPMPFVDSGEAIHAIGAGATVEEAMNDGLQGMIRVLEDRLGWGYIEAAQFLGASADIRICQVVNPTLNVRVSVRKADLPELRL